MPERKDSQKDEVKQANQETETKMSEEDVVKAFFSNKSWTNNFKEAAIYAFVLAKLALGKGDKTRAEEFAGHCLELIKRCPTSTMEECAHSHINIAGVFIPELFHEGTVRRDLASVIS